MPTSFRKLALFAAACSLALISPAAAHCNYIVEEGDSLDSIARGYDIDIANITALNDQIEDPNLIYDGDVLRLPCKDSESEGSIAELLEHRSDTYYAFTAIVKAGLLKELSKNKKWTAFIPTDDAFEAFFAESGLNLSALAADPKKLADVLSYHISPDGALEASDLENNQEVSTLLEGQDLTIGLENGTVLIKTTSGQEAKVVKADLDAGRSVVHLVDEVLLSGEEKPAPAPPAEPVPTPEPAPAPTPATPTQPPCTYTVKAGDTLYEIGQRYGLTVQAIVALNPKLKANPDLIQPGTVVVLRRCRQPARKALL
ncbi:hypothetical protein ABPG77_004648 [Micractinium sp. CCAP 211/92]